MMAHGDIDTDHCNLAATSSGGEIDNGTDRNEERQVGSKKRFIYLAKQLRHEAELLRERDSCLRNNRSDL